MKKNRSDVRLYPAPKTFDDMFILDGRRYFSSMRNYLISDYGKYGFCPPVDRGFYLKLSAKEFKECKARYEAKRFDYEKALAGNLNKGVQSTLF